ncbi:MAG: sugar ABC transporter permease [Chloroflexi bacterium]|nr:sugar ABC transporter permease [Chloroflexota bacterium]
MAETVRRERVDEVRAQGRAAVLGAFWEELKGIRREGWGNLWGYFFIAPAVIMYLIFQAWPILRGLFMAFSDYRWLLPETHGLSGFNGLENWIEMFGDKTFWRSLGIALKFTLMFLPFTLALSVFVAVMISRVRNPTMAAVYRVIAYMPVVLPVSVAMLVWAKLYDPKFGYLNVMLKNLGVQNPPNWLGSPKTALIAMTLPTIWSRFGYWTLLFLIGIYNINSEIYEAALVDGANGWQQLWSITLPLLKPIFTLVLVLGSGIVSATVESMALFQGTSGGPAESALTAGVYLYRTAFIHGDMRMGYAATMSLFLSFINMIITFIVFRTMRTESN